MRSGGLRRTRRWLPWLGALATLATAAPLAAGDLAEALARPLSPGGLARLMEHAQAPEVRQRWTEALRSERPEVRAAAARVINVVGAGELTPAVVEALAVETDPAPAMELARAAVGLGDAAAAAAAAQEAARLHDSRVSEALAVAVGRRYAGGSYRLLDSLRAVPEFPWGSLFDALLQGDGRRLQPFAAAAVRLGDTRMWRAFAATADAAGVEPATGLLVAALGAHDPETRSEIRLWLARRLLSAEQASGVTQALDAPLPDGARGDDEPAAFAGLLLARSLGRPAADDRPWPTWLASDPAKSLTYRLAHDEKLVRLLRDDERAAVSRSTGIELNPGKHDERPPWIERDPDWTSPYPRLLSVSGFPPGFVEDARRVSGCKPGRAKVAAAETTFGADGRPRRVQRVKTDVDGNCAELGLVLLASTLYPDAQTPPSAAELMVAPLNKNFLECLAEPEDPDPAPVPPGPGVLQPPKQTRNVPPVYPADAKQKRVQGMVVMEADVSRSGCIARLRTLRGVIPSLDWSALNAVSQWRYTPARIDGRPVPLHMTVTVNFRLN